MHFNRLIKGLLILSMSLVIVACAHDPIVTAEQDYERGDYSATFAQVWLPAHHGDAVAQYTLGYLYFYGLGTSKDEDLGRYWIRRAANVGYEPAAVALELMVQARDTQYPPFGAPNHLNQRNLPPRSEDPRNSMSNRQDAVLEPPRMQPKVNS